MAVKVGLKFIEKWKTDLEAQVCKYEAENAEKGQIVFYGPSNFTRWSAKWGMTPLAEALPGKSGKACCVNRGFGSTCTEHHLYYYQRMVRAIEPKILVYSPGIGNGLSFGYTKEELYEMAERVVLYAKSDMPDLKIYIIGPNLFKDKRESSRIYAGWLKELAEKTPDCVYADLTDYEPMQRLDIYVQDNVHYNKEGYDLYAGFFRQLLKDELDQF